MTQYKNIIDLINIDCNFDHIVFDPINNRQNGYIFKTVKFKAVLSFVV